MAYEADAVFVPIMPSFRGFGKALTGGLGSSVKRAGAKAGQDYSASLADGALKGAAKVEATEKKVADAVSAASKKMTAARQAEEDATRKARTEELRLQELRDSGKAKASALSAAEDRLVRSQRALTSAQEQAHRAGQDYDDTLERGTRELREASDEASKAKGKFGRLGSALKGSLGGLGPGTFNPLRKAAQDEGQASGRAFGRTFGGGLKAGLGLAAGAFAVLKGLDVVRDFVSSSFAEARDSQKVGATTEAIIKSTGGTAKLTASQIGDLSTAISNKTGVDDEAIQSGSNLLLTFKNVRDEAGKGNDVFSRATAAAVDLSKAGFGSISGASKMLGKALNDPVKGITALGRAGVTFTDGQKKQIAALVKSGDVLGAQKIIMKEVESQVGGVAAASTTAGEKLKTAWDNSKEAIGTALLPALDGAQNALRTDLIPLITNVLVPALPGIARGLSTAIGVVRSFGRIASGAVKPFVASLSDGQAGVKSLGDFLATHQGDITQFFVTGGHVAIGFAKVVAGVLVGIIGGLRGLNAGVNVALVGILKFASDAASALALVTRPVNPALADSLDGIAGKLDGMADHAVTKSKAMDDALAGASDGITGKLLPALDAADDGLTKVGNAEVSKAAQRDAANKTALAIKGIGTAADGSQIHLKQFRDISKLSATEQAGLKARIGEAKTALQGQLGSLQAAGAGQKQLTAAWKEGRSRLYDEFRQMGLSKDAAKDLAAKYAGIKPKVQTKVTQPGMSGARSDTKDLKKKIDSLHGKNVKINYSSNAADLAKQWGIKTKNYKAHENTEDVGSGQANGLTSPGLARGGFVRGRRRGGVLPGFTPLSGGDDVAFPMSTGGIQPLRGGEGIAVSEAMRDPFERARLLAVNKAALRGESLTKFRPGLATGGLVRSISTPVSTKGLGLPDFGAITDKLADGITSVLAPAIGKKLSALGGGGGNTGKALAYAKAHVGHPYQFGTIWDCSGFIGTLQNIAEGKKVGGRRYSTPAFHGDKAQGFTRGKKSNFMIGVNPNPGKSGHMAGTINGTNVESAGGVGVRVGKSARGWNAGMFSWRGGLARGGLVPGYPAGDLPWDLINKRGQRYDPKLRQAVRQTPLRHATYDTGGVLAPGLTLAYNGTGRPETIRTFEQERSLVTAGSSRPARNFNFYGPTGATAPEVAAFIASRERLADALDTDVY